MLWALWRLVAPNKADPTYDYGFKAKAAALVTIALWIGAIVSGRYIAYTLPPF
jgi:hypothetical protein